MKQLKAMDESSLLSEYEWHLLLLIWKILSWRRRRQLQKVANAMDPRALFDQFQFNLNITER